MRADRFVLEIEDNGRGIAPADREKGRNGLRNLRKRMEDVGGTCDIVARDGGGTTVRLSAPLAATVQGNGSGP
jgi:signal transduction histidine kinase